MKILLPLLSLIIICSCGTNISGKSEGKTTLYFNEQNYLSESFFYDLRQIKEPKVSSLNDKNIEIYRLTSSGFGASPKVLKIEKTDSYIFLTAISKFKNIKRTTKKISSQDFAKFKADLKKFNVESFPAYLDNSVDDGIQYCLEINDKGNYKAIFRNNPQTRNTDPKFLEITDLFYKLEK